MDFLAIAWGGGIDWIDLAEDRWVLMKMVMNLQVLQNFVYL